VALIARPRLGSNEELDRNKDALHTGAVEPRNGLVGFFEKGQGPSGRPIIIVNGENGSVDIGGTKDRDGLLVLRNKNLSITFFVDGESGTTKQSGDIVLHDSNQQPRLQISGQKASIVIQNASGQPIIHLDGTTGDIVLGGSGQDGALKIKSAPGQVMIELDGQQGGATFQKVMVQGQVASKDVVTTDAQIKHNLTVAETTTTKQLSATDGVFEQALSVKGTLTAGTATTKQLSATDGVFEQALSVKGTLTAGTATTKQLSATDGVFEQALSVKGTLTAGALTGERLDTAQAQVRGKLTVVGEAHLGQLETGQITSRDITVLGPDGHPKIVLDANAGDIHLLNADLAEDFDTAEPHDIEPGTVVVLNQEGKLCPSTTAYDRRVAGIVSGAGKYRPGIVLDKRSASTSPRLSVALTGKVYCKVDAEQAPVEVGDLLTTSATPGHAMKAGGATQAFGAVIGKALQPLKAGKGMIPVLVTLQ
jgi:hypothetical protein